MNEQNAKKSGPERNGDDDLALRTAGGRDMQTDSPWRPGEAPAGQKGGSSGGGAFDDDGRAINVPEPNEKALDGSV